MHLLVTGGSGLVGWKLVQRSLLRGHQVTYTCHTTDPTSVEETEATQTMLDIRNGEQVAKLLDRYKPDTVIHTAAMTDVDECERSPDKATAVNVTGTKNIVAACETQDVPLLFFSTGFVFDEDGAKVTEDAERTPVNHYARTKIRAEDTVMNAEIPWHICRIDQPYCWPTTWQDLPFVSWILEQCDDGEPFYVFTDWYNTPVYVPDCNTAVLRLVETGVTGVFHVCGPDYVDRFTWARQIAEHFGHDPSLIKPSHSSNSNLPAERPNNHLSNEKIRNTLDISFRNIQTALTDMATRRPRQ